MLILVGVTINFAINGGIINKAKTASSDIQKAADKEELQMAVISALDYNTGVLDRTELVSGLSSNWQVSNEAPYTCTSPSGNIFTVTAGGIITNGEGSGGNSGTDQEENNQSQEIETLAGLTFEAPPSNATPAERELYGDSFDYEAFIYSISFDESTVILKEGEKTANGTYTYDPSNHSFDMTLTVQEEEYTLSNLVIHEIKENGIVVNRYFELNNDAVFTTNGNIRTFSSIYGRICF